MGQKEGMKDKRGRVGRFDRRKCMQELEINGEIRKKTGMEKEGREKGRSARVG
jgi:hypothetical protein